MNTIDYFYKKAKTIIKHSEGQVEDQRIAALRDHLVTNLKDFPKELVFDVFNFYLQDYFDQPQQERSLYDLADSFLPILSFFHGEPLAQEREFSDQEWTMIRESISASADFMDLEKLNFLVGVLVEKGQY